MAQTDFTTFQDWLFPHVRRKSLVGDFARDFFSDSDGPQCRIDSRAALLAHLQAVTLGNPCDGAIRAAKLAWAAYVRALHQAPGLQAVSRAGNWDASQFIPIPAGLAALGIFRAVSAGMPWDASQLAIPTRGGRDDAPLGGMQSRFIYRGNKTIPVLLPLKRRFESSQLTNCLKYSQITWDGFYLRWRQSTKHERYGVFSLGPSHALAKNKGFRAIVGRLVLCAVHALQAQRPVIGSLVRWQGRLASVRGGSWRLGPRAWAVDWRGGEGVRAIHHGQGPSQAMGWLEL